VHKLAGEATAAPAGEGYSKESRRMKDMNGINGYQVYQNSYVSGAYADAYGKTGAAKDEGTVQSRYGKDGVAQAAGEQVSLSDDAKDLLERLKKKYGNMDFFVGNYGSDEEAERYLSAGTKEYSVLIEPEVLEKMAADKDEEKKYTAKIDEATAKLSELKDSLGDEKDNVVSLGVSFGKDGSTTYFAELEKAGEQQKERIEKSRTEKKEKAAKEKKAQERREQEKRLGLDGSDRVQKTRVSADTTDGLLEKIRNVDWNSVKPQQRETVGGIINYGV